MASIQADMGIGRGNRYGCARKCHPCGQVSISKAKHVCHYNSYSEIRGFLGFLLGLRFLIWKNTQGDK